MKIGFSSLRSLFAVCTALITTIVLALPSAHATPFPDPGNLQPVPSLLNDRGNNDFTIQEPTPFYIVDVPGIQVPGIQEPVTPDKKLVVEVSIPEPEMEIEPLPSNVRFPFPEHERFVVNPDGQIEHWLFPVNPVDVGNYRPALTNQDLRKWRTDEFNSQYGLGLIGVDHQYEWGAIEGNGGGTGKGTLGVVMDSGLDLNHADIDLERIRTDLGRGFSLNKFPKVELIAKPDTAEWTDKNGHGTHVLGIMGASKNDTGIHGIAPDADYMAFKAHWSWEITYYQFVDALNRAVDAGADAMNNSWSFSLRDIRNSEDYTALELFRDSKKYVGAELYLALRNAMQNGLSIVFAAGNDSYDTTSVWGRLPKAAPEIEGNFIVVTALTKTDSLENAEVQEWANKCGAAMNWCLAAPGTDILSLDKTITETYLRNEDGSFKRNNDGSFETVVNVDRNATRELSGTSMAAPHVTGAILVLKSRFPELTTPEIHQILFDTAYDLGEPGIDPVYGHGALDLRNAHAPQGQIVAELGETVDQRTALLSETLFVENPVTGGVLADALSEQTILVTDRYDRSYFASLGPTIVPGGEGTEAMETGLHAAFNRTAVSDFIPGFGLRLDAFDAGHDVTRIAHMDPVIAQLSARSGIGFSMQVPVEKATVSMASVTAPDARAVSLGVGLVSEQGHGISFTAGHAVEEDRILGATAAGAFAGLNSETLYGRIQTDIAVNEKVMLNGSVTAGQTSFNGAGLLSNGRADTLAMAFGLTLNDALADGDKLSLALARPLAVSGGHVTVRSGTGISPAAKNRRTDRISFTETTVPLGAADQASELHLGYMREFDAGWADANFTFGGVARLDGGTRVMVARTGLVFKF